MSRIVPIAILLLAALAASPRARAEEPITTANDAASGGSPGTAASSPALPDASPWTDEPELLLVGACGQVREASDPHPLDRKAHGQVEIGVGTGGYRHVRATVCKPIGDDGSITIDVAHTEWKGRRARFADGELVAQTGAEPPYRSMGTR